jgi:CheY-like chemotaxis protein
MKKILLVDDERNVHYSLQRALGEAFRIISASSGEEALQKLTLEKPHLILLDVKLPGLGGLEILQQIKALDRELPVVLLTAYGTTETAITAMKLGAYDYLLKPVDIATLKGLIAKALHQRDLAAQVDALSVPEPAGKPSLLGRSAAMQDLYKMIGRVAPTDMTVLLSGESGTGKELVAQAIHQHSVRAEGPWVALNCAAIPESLLESELFGHERGASPGRPNGNWGALGKPPMAPSSSMRSANCRLQCRRNCCDHYRRRKFAAWAAERPSRSMSASSLPPIKTSKPRLPGESFAKTFTIVSPSSTSTCLRYGRGRRISPCSPTISSLAPARDWSGRWGALPPKPSTGCWPTPGQAMSESWRTPLNRLCSRAAAI